MLFYFRFMRVIEKFISILVFWRFSSIKRLSMGLSSKAWLSHITWCPHLWKHDLTYKGHQTLLLKNFFWETLINFSFRIIKISTLPLTCITKISNLFLIQFIFKWAKISLFTLSLRIVFSVMLHSSYFFGSKIIFKITLLSISVWNYLYQFVNGEL